MELEPAYVVTILRRSYALTDSSALHVATGFSFGDLAREAECADAI